MKSPPKRKAEVVNHLNQRKGVVASNGFNAFAFCLSLTGL